MEDVDDTRSKGAGNQGKAGLRIECLETTEDDHHRINRNNNAQVRQRVTRRVDLVEELVVVCGARVDFCLSNAVRRARCAHNTHVKDDDNDRLDN